MLEESQKMNIGVVGSGIAGLTAAWALKRAGHRVTVLESQRTAGGRCRDIILDGLRVRSGARLLYNFHPDLIDLIKAVGLESEIIHVGHSDMACDTGSMRYKLDLSPSPNLIFNSLLPLSERLQLARLIPHLLHARIKGTPDDIVSLCQVDDVDLSSFLHDLGLPIFADRIVRPLFRGARGWEPKDISPAFFLLSSAHGIGSKTFTFRQGIGQLTATLAQQLPVQYGIRVVEIAEQTEAVNITAADEQGNRHLWSFDQVICATEGDRALSIIKGADSEMRQFLTDVRYNRLGITYAVLQKDVQHSLTFHTTGHPSGLAVIESVPATPHARAHFFCELAPEALADLPSGRPLSDAIAPQLKVQLAQHGLTSWVDQRIDSMLPIPYPGYARKIAKFRSWRTGIRGRIYLAGDYLANALVGGACASGKQAAQTLLDHWCKP